MKKRNKIASLWEKVSMVLAAWQMIMSLIRFLKKIKREIDFSDARVFKG
ncbi:hypothetical protein [Lacticaseibacillus paracasei]|nr:hypothetical protein [Lacticaseibacillus paracasei]